MNTTKNLYQWDINQKLVNCDGRYVDFPINNEIYRVEVTDGECMIPDELLQSYGRIKVYECMEDGTLKEFVFDVTERSQPPDYVYTPTERLTFDGLVQKVDDAVADMERRADAGEFDGADGYTPVNGKDYFTESEKTEMMESVSSGAIGEFRKVVDTATTEYNDNHNLKLAKYNANASEKLTTYDTNAEQQTTDYNRNAAEKLEAYNSNHTEKVAEYNANAETKTAEFDANAAALKTEVDRLRGECDQLAAENRKQENKISALIKLNKGQTYDILPEEGESTSRTAPSGAKYVSVDKVGGKSVVWNQLLNPDGFDTLECTVSESSGVVTITNCGKVNRYKAGFISVTRGHKYYQTVTIKSDGTNPVGFQNYLFLDIDNKITSAEFTRLSVAATCTESGKALVQLYSGNNTDYQVVKNSFMLFDLTLLFGAGNEPTAEQFERMFPADSYPYNPGEIISSRTETITAGAETITTGFPELHSAGIAHDEIDMDSGAIRRNVGTVDLGSLSWSYSDKYEWLESNSMIGQIVAPAGSSLAANAICNRFEIVKQNDNYIKPGVSVWTSGKISVKSDEIKSAEDLSGVTFYYEKATPTTEQVAVPEALQEWLPVEAGGTVTFQNADESKQLPVPNAVSWVRKLNEVN